jgi:excisionase family DNA binding protein
MAENDFLTVSECSEWLRLGKSTIYSLVQKNEIPHIKVGGKILFERAKIKIWIDNKSNY